LGLINLDTLGETVNDESVHRCLMFCHVMGSNPCPDRFPLNAILMPGEGWVVLLVTRLCLATQYVTAPPSGLVGPEPHAMRYEAEPRNEETRNDN
jgi:hypothetical protein